MDDFAVIYRVLDQLRDAMDYDEFDASRLAPEAYHVTQNRLDSILAMLAAEGYVTGIAVSYAGNMRTVKPLNPAITLRGLEYLSENTLMRRAARLAKGIKDATPFL